MILVCNYRFEGSETMQTSKLSHGKKNQQTFFEQKNTPYKQILLRTNQSLRRGRIKVKQSIVCLHQEKVYIFQKDLIKWQNLSEKGQLLGDKIEIGPQEKEG
ncbi:unnamed protein product [Paramecium sonneborni]|uniref:Uncharacterized protein n=1 Tax=Paramecium sonneborni TaxID=65129 RepID=A0A8S1RNX8_9CILI|nr:unnamed protein product [Paramecium sonneborni]